MNVGEIKTRVRRTFGDESSVQVLDSDILTWINDGQREIVMHNNELLEKISTANIISGQQDYSFPSDLLQLRSLKFRQDSTVSYGKLDGRSMQEFDEIIDGWEGPSYGQANPRFYCTFNNVIKLFPIPVNSVTDGLKLYYYRIPTDRVNDIDIIDLPINYHGAIVEYCLKQAYELDEDWTSVGNKANEFNSSVEGQKSREKAHNTETYTRITVLADDQGWEY